MTAKKFAGVNLDVKWDWHWKAVLYLRGGDGGEHGPFLYDIVKKTKAKTVVDVGTARGFSALYMAKALADFCREGTVYTIDIIPHDEPWSWHGPKQSESDPAYGKLMTRKELMDVFNEKLVSRIVFLTGSSQRLLRNWPYPTIDLAFVDGSHSYADVKADLKNIKQNLNPKGVIVLDDYVSPETRFQYRGYSISKTRFEGVWRAVEECIREGEWFFEFIPLGYMFPWRRTRGHGLAILRRSL